jgi:hypothetical protein
MLSVLGQGKILTMRDANNSGIIFVNCITIGRKDSSFLELAQILLISMSYYLKQITNELSSHIKHKITYVFGKLNSEVNHGGKVNCVNMDPNDQIHSMMFGSLSIM